MIIIMGVSGSGKSTIGKLLSEKIDSDFYDADDFHPQENINKMKNGIALSDEDRLPWLESLTHKIVLWNKNPNSVLACSALKESYRKILNEKAKNTQWVYLYGSFNDIIFRLEKREQHFMDTSLLQSQFDVLEVPNYGIHIDIKQTPEEIVQNIMTKLNLHE